MTTGATMQITIEKNIPVPRPRLFSWGRPLTPEGAAVLAMEVGDSFFVAGGISKGHGLLSYARRKHKDRKFCVRTVTEDGVKGVRVWRIV